MPQVFAAAKPAGPRGSRAAGALALLLGLLFFAACASSPRPAGPAEPPKRVQRILFQVLDGRDGPIAGARVTLTPVAGRPVKARPLATDPDGRVLLRWRPQATDETAGLVTSDRVWRLDTELRYLVEAPGFLPAAGEIQRRDRDQAIASPELQRLNRRASLAPMTETVVLRKRSEVLGPRLAKLGPGSRVYKKCLAFHRANQPLVRRLGADFAWPAFLYKAGRLTLRLDWQGASWEGLAEAPLLARVAFGAGMPLAMVCGEELLPLPEVKALRLVFISKVTSKSDPHALPTISRVILAGPAADFTALAAGRLSPDAFLAKHTPRLIQSRARARQAEIDRAKQAEIDKAKQAAIDKAKKAEMEKAKQAEKAKAGAAPGAKPGTPPEPRKGN